MTVYIFMVGCAKIVGSGTINLRTTMDHASFEPEQLEEARKQGIEQAKARWPEADGWSNYFCEFSVKVGHQRLMDLAWKARGT